ncbi:hypothetical protein D3C81_1774060 [compost metagenome]
MPTHLKDIAAIIRDNPANTAVPAANSTTNCSQRNAGMALTCAMAITNSVAPPKNNPTLSGEKVVATIKNSGFRGFSRTTSKLPSRIRWLVVHITPPKIRLDNPLDMVKTDWISSTS